MNWNVQYALLLLLSTVATWACGILLDKTQVLNRKKLLVAACFAVNLGILFFFKYFNFFISVINDSFNSNIVPLNILLPVGISFYTFQALGYTIDVYRGNVEAEYNFIRYAVFVAFFPQLVAGPIERSKNMLGQIRHVAETTREELLNPYNIRNGLILMLWGLFMKLVIADRVAILVDNVFDAYTNYGRLALLYAAIGFGIQIYCDFGSYSIIAIGSAKIMNIKLMENFNTPYFADSVTDFWRRWHISLSTWFRDYLYIPLGGNRKGQFRKVINTMVTFTVSGLWHGANWTFVFWGFLHGIYLTVEYIFKIVTSQIGITRTLDKLNDNPVIKAVKTIITFAFVDFAWIFFRAYSLSEARAYLFRMFDLSIPFMPEDSIYVFGLDATEVNILMGSLLILFIVDIIRISTAQMIDEWICAKNIIFRAFVVIMIAFITILYGVYGPGFESKQFIYFQF